uniref:Variant surface glycoprotein n=1 Tax=Trypanosoma brucei TaxID=5691 RepID=A0A1V0FYJ3_9TRYP|nr:variant surface glycoprotein [Trypanosoma brucei]
MTMLSSVVLILVGSKLRVEAAIAACGNKAEYSGICALARLSRSHVAIPNLNDLTSVGYAEPQAYNMSVSGANWQKIFFTGKPDPKHHEIVPERAPTPNDWQTKWQEWLQDKKEIDAQPESPTLKNTAFAKVTSQHKNHIRALINDLTDQAARLMMQLKEDPTTVAKLEAVAVRAKLKEPLTGTASKPEPAAAAADRLCVKQGRRTTK